MSPLSRCAVLIAVTLTALGAAQPAPAAHRPTVTTQPHHSQPLRPGLVHGEPVRG